MTLPRPLIAAALAFAAAFTVLYVLNRDDRPAPSLSEVASESRGELQRASTPDLIRKYQRALGAAPSRPEIHVALADAYMSREGETGDPRFFVRAEEVLARAERIAPNDYRVLAGLGTLANSRHDFAEGLRRGLQTRAANPASNAAYPVIIDSLIELGRYGDAERELQAFADRKPALASYSRVSYFRELNGDVPGAIEAMRMAISAGGDSPGDTASVQNLLGGLELGRGRVAEAQQIFQGVLARSPGDGDAALGLANVDVARGRLDSAIRRYRDSVARIPDPAQLATLGELELATGQIELGRRHVAQARAEEKRLLSQGNAKPDADTAVLEADHGSPARAVEIARAAWAAAPSVRAADAMGWALTRAGRPHEGLAWARRALRLGSRDPLFLYHAGIAARGVGRNAEARTYLRRALAINPRFSPLYAADARRALQGLGG
jgi:tetratricopeptide (TPR) repeat protein